MDKRGSNLRTKLQFNNDDRLKNRLRKSRCLTIAAAITVLTAVITMVLFWQTYLAQAGAPDTTPPTLVKSEPTSKQLVYLTFSEPVQFNTPVNWYVYKYVNGTYNGTVSYGNNPQLVSSDKRIVRLAVYDSVYGNQYPTPIRYKVVVSNISDLSNNGIDMVYNSAYWDGYSPHGKYAKMNTTDVNNTRLCGQCHIAHNSIGKELLNKETVKRVCFVCHGTTGISAYKVESEFTSRLAGGSQVSYSLHKSLDIDNPAGNDVLYCTDCHNPHGDIRTGNEIYPKLLKVYDVAGTVYYSGNGFCLACHGANNKIFKTQNNMSVYYATYGGDHRYGMTAEAGGAIPHYSTAFAAMKPASGTDITCVKCHERHGSQYGSLLDNSRTNSEEEQCYKCHGKDANYGMTGVNVYNLITTSVSQHKVGSTTYGKVECTNCHGPHTAGNAKFNAGLSYSAISDPDNTKNPFTTSSGRFSQFCLKCHDSGQPGATTNETTKVPYTISFIDPGFSTNGGKWNKDAPISFTASGHYTNTQLRGQTDAYGNAKNECSLCHDWHGTPYKWLVRLDEDKNGADGICLQCHKSGSGYTNPAGVSDLDVKTDFGLAKRHPTIDAGYAGRHSNTENYNRSAEATTSVRHAQCYDCHDPHTVKAGNGQLDEIGNVTGVNATIWSGGTGTQPFDNYFTNTTLSFVDLQPSTGNNVQAYLCFKCHSMYAYTPQSVSVPNGQGGNTTDTRAPFNNPSNNGTAFPQTDIARDFNPNIKARHDVTGGGFSPMGNWTYIYNSVTYRYGEAGFINGWSWDSVLKCTDCHGPQEGSGGAKGPHGSANAFMLVRPWNPNANPTSSDLCFKCHSFTYYSSGTGWSADNTKKSGFSSSADVGWNGHVTKHDGVRCSGCHGGMPHSWKYVDSSGNYGIPFWGKNDPKPYSEGAKMTMPTDANRAPGGWNQEHWGGSCTRSGC